MQTIKLKYMCVAFASDLIMSYQKQYSSCLHYNYNRLMDDESLTERDLRNNSINIRNCDLIKSYLMQCSIKEAKQLVYGSDKSIIFGGRKLFFKRLKNLISKDDYKIKKLNPVYVIGEKLMHGNRLVQIDKDLNTLHVKFSKKDHFDLTLLNVRNRLDILERLYHCQVNNLIPITYRIDAEYVCISFDETILNTDTYMPVKDRVLALDLNPNYIGWSVVDWKSSSEFDIVKTGVYSIKNLNDMDFGLKDKSLSSDSKERTHISNKRNHEVLQMSKNLIDTARHYRCEIFSIEDLNIKSSDNERGTGFNRLCNNLWCRNKLVNNLSKRCNIFSIKFLKVKANYSSFIGNILFRDLCMPDMVLASIEIGRRAFEFNRQYMEKTTEIKKNIIQPRISDFRDLVSKSLEEFGIKEKFDNFVDMYYFFKNSKLKYRVSLDDLNPKFFRFFSSKSKIKRFFCYI